MGFSFGFTQDQLDSSVPEKEVQNIDVSNPLDSVEVTQQPRVINLADMLSSSVGTRITYDTVKLVSQQTIYRRELFDVKQQLMTEDDFKEGKQNDLFEILIGDTEEDLKNGVYEGGLKSWECSYDLIGKLETLKLDSNGLIPSQPFNCIELGCGTSLPSLYIFDKVIRDRREHAEHRQPVNMVLSDYNYEVLRLVTLPNLFINWCLLAIPQERLQSLQGGQEGSVRQDEIYVSPLLAEAFIQWLKNHHIEVNLISGSWCRGFIDIVHTVVPDIEQTTNLVLTSETIYSPAILPVIGEIILELTFGNQPYTILTAKDIYFGVGGSVNQLLEYLQKRNKREDGAFIWQIEKVNSSLRRSIVSICKRAECK
ncbi:DEKNAAC100813 [Brettanomyces naardenensis]|uniref:protein-histidine N-methyltransferase n=1 Tax=Brettanomyces naardenensis TaxID=13370 RepID=A0A448YFT5_BRENA|nr:DEKNAAC100813 [Brettanomyces naardenensis]